LGPHEVTIGEGRGRQMRGQVGRHLRIGIRRISIRNASQARASRERNAGAGACLITR
jgi:hypothetical protein